MNCMIIHLQIYVATAQLHGQPLQVHSNENLMNIYAICIDQVKFGGVLRVPCVQAIDDAKNDVQTPRGSSHR